MLALVSTEALLMGQWLGDLLTTEIEDALLFTADLPRASAGRSAPDDEAGSLGTGLVSELLLDRVVID